MNAYQEIHVSVSNKTETCWNELANAAFSDFYFTFPNTICHLNSGEMLSSCKIVLIPEEDQSLLYNVVGSDPFKKSYLHILVVELNKSGFFGQDIKDIIAAFISRCQMTLVTHAIIIMDKSASFFRTNNTVIRDNPFLSEYINNLLIVPWPKDVIASEKLELIRPFVITRVFHDCELYFNDITRKLQIQTDNVLEKEYFSTWILLFYLSIGYVQAPLHGFMDKIAYLRKNYKHEVKELVKKIISINSLNNYPIIQSQDYNISDILMFAVQGAMCISNMTCDFITTIRLFIDHFTFLRSSSQNETDEALVDDWAVSSIVSMINLFHKIPVMKQRRSSLGDNPYAVSTSVISNYQMQLYVSLFSLLYPQDTQSQILSIVAAFNETANASLFHSVEMVRALYSEWALRNNNMSGINESEYPHNGVIGIGWKVINNFNFYRMKKSRDLVEIKNLAQNLLSKRANFDMRNETLDYLASLDREIQIQYPDLVVKVDSEAFSSKILCDNQFIISIKGKYPEFFNCGVESVTLFLSRDESSDEKYSKLMTPKLDEPLSFDCEVSVAGIWRLSRLEFKYGSCTIVRDLLIDFGEYSIKVAKRIAPPISVNFPSLVYCDSSQTMTVEINLSNCFASEIYVKIVPLCSISFPAQKIQALVNDKTKIKLKLNSEGEFSQIFPFSKTKFELSFEINSLEPSENASFAIITNIEEDEFRKEFSYPISFPIECTARILTDEIIQVCLKNISVSAIEMVSAKLGQEEFPFETIPAGSSTFLLSHASTPVAILTAVFGEKGRPGRAHKGWNLSKCVDLTVPTVLTPPHPHAGSVVLAALTLPMCSFAVGDMGDFVVSGVLRRAEFEGGRLTLSLIPKRPGLLRLPKVLVNGVEHSMRPMFIRVSAGEVLSFCPFVEQ